MKRNFYNYEEFIIYVTCGVGEFSLWGALGSLTDRGLQSFSGCCTEPFAPSFDSSALPGPGDINNDHSLI